LAPTGFLLFIANVDIQLDTS